jgi:site-specific recombinase XerD
LCHSAPHPASGETVFCAGVHSLRHTFATHHFAMGTDLVTVQEFLGHSSLDTTKLYIGLAKKRQAQHIQDHAL